MSQVVSFSNYTPPARYDAEPWTDVRIEEAATEDGSFTTIDTVALSPVDVDPSDPAVRSFTTDQGTAPELWYRVVFLDAGLNESAATTPSQNLAGAVTFIDAEPYATVDELARILKIRSPTTEQTVAMTRVLSHAAGEINSEIGLSNSDLSSWQLDLAEQVNLDRAADLWRHTESIPGMTGLLGEGDGSPLPGRYSWERYAQRLATIKAEWGIA